MSDRFAFGKNWTAFLSVINEDRIASAVEKLSAMLGDLKGKTFLDIGSGSGIHSLAAVRLGAARVRSFDYDQDSVNCTAEMKRRFAPNANWTIEQGSALDENFMHSLGQFDVVYSWGVLHHTGDMWKALELATVPAKDVLMVAIYNDEGWMSSAWKSVKARYNRSGKLGKRSIELLTFLVQWGGMAAYYTAKLKPLEPVRKWRDYGQLRGMSAWHDVVDWAGGYPFEVATPQQIETFYHEHGFRLKGSKLTRRNGCNEFVFTR
jgi:16S rRNA G966 N2-methylase RsmD